MIKYRLKIPKDTTEDLFTLALRGYEEDKEIITENWASTGYTLTVRGVDFKVPTINFKEIPKEFLEEIKESEFCNFMVENFERYVRANVDHYKDYDLADMRKTWKASEKNTHKLYSELVDYVNDHLSKNGEYSAFHNRKISSVIDKINKVLQNAQD